MTIRTFSQYIIAFSLLLTLLVGACVAPPAVPAAATPAPPTALPPTAAPTTVPTTIPAPTATLSTTAATAIRDFVLTTVADIRDIPPELWRGELGYLAAISPAVHRLALELTDRLAAALAAAISDSTAVPPEIARLQGTALASVFQVIISESGRRTREGQSQAEIADELYPLVENVLVELDSWLSVSGSLRC